MEIDGKVEGLYLLAVEEELNAEQMRSAMISTYATIHSYIFSNTGNLLFATAKASEKVVKESGESALSPW